ncbi:hypothetical protein PFICI_14633 [Pestalotiopsis fici W106-1]|uniref:Uncharacterized protein n=1 Tax=Pestalotiopsis fici (strain W106-1 / CGMCC3.15140) TaxID=1229662 RepID=W3WKJ5_PESFW|nr:uncharacterized protein PFICI_14633 [Pestalotiopsis fici W106-1]ETS73687.1 hypothetical protein PFICI_14633 [Pestalotiopsis fici W106-1]
MKEELGIFLRLGRGGSIVNISSDAGSVASAGCAAYVASKHGINGLTKTAALEYAKSGIRVNAVAPGNIDTPMMHQFGDTAKIVRETQPTGRCGQPEEVAELVCFLSSERCTSMTGSIVAVDGGITTTGYSGILARLLLALLFNKNLSQRENSTDFYAKVLAHTFFQCISDFDTSDSCFIT